MEHFTVAVIGGGATGTGILRDLALRGISAVLFEQGSFAHGTSARFHGLLHSGARYAVKDAEAARECLEENMILRRVAAQCVEETEGYFVLVDGDDEAYVPQWQEACSRAGISAEEVSLAEAFFAEPNLNRNARRVFRVPDSCVDGFRLLWHNAAAAASMGSKSYTYHKVLKIHNSNGQITGLTVLDRNRKKTREISCNFIINAAGAWSGEVASMAGLDVPVAPDKGTLLVFNHRFTSRVINRLRPSGDGDIFVPHGSVTIFGTTSTSVDSPSYNRPTTDEVLKLMDLGRPLFPDIDNYRMLRAFAGNRPLYAAGGKGRQASRNFHIVDHKADGLDGLISIFGGKLTTYRLMAEKAVDMACDKLGIEATCKTASVPLVPSMSSENMQKAAKYFSQTGATIVADRVGADLPALLDIVESADFSGEEKICECEMVSKAEIALVAKDSSTYSLGDIRLRTRFGMGTCQGTFCTLRTMGLLAELKLVMGKTPLANIRSFLQERWQGVRPILWGSQMKEAELTRAIYAASLNIDGSLLGQNESDDLDQGPADAIEQDLPPANTTAALVHRHTPEIFCAKKQSDVVVVGAGLAGLTAALAASRQGSLVTLLSKGGGTFNISGGNVDLLGYAGGALVHDPWLGMDLLPEAHPYSLMGKERVREGLDFFKGLCEDAGYALVDNGDKNIFVPTILGTLKPTYLCPQSVNPFYLEKAKHCMVVGIQGFKDCGVAMLSAELRSHPDFAGKQISTYILPNPIGKTHRPVNALDVARFLDTQDGQDWLIKQLRPNLKQADVIIAPPICGTVAQHNAWRNLSSGLGVPIVEMNSVPPGVGGLRLKNLMMQALVDAGVELVENAVVGGAVIDDGLCHGVYTNGIDGARLYQAKSFVLATGGILGGGLDTSPVGIIDNVFGLNIPGPSCVEDRSSPQVFGRHFYAQAGVAVDEHLRPIDIHTGGVVLANVFVAGRSLGGYDFAREKSGHGVAVTSGWYAGTQAGKKND